MAGDPGGTPSMTDRRPGKMLTRTRRLAGALALSFLAAASGLAQQPPDRPSVPWTIPGNDDIRRLLDERMARNGVGIVVGVIEPGGRRIVVHGRSGAPDRRPLDGDTVFQIGSVTKVFTGLLLADMVQRGEVGVDDPAAKYLPPGVTMPQRGRPITLIDLSKHWSALPSMPTNFSLQASPNPYEAYSVEQLYECLSSYELPREPGTQQYSNLGVALLGRLLARRAGTEYETLLQQRVLTPLGLESTSISLSADQRRRLAPGHDRYLRPVESWNLLSMPGSGALRSTANDLLTFLSFHLGERESPLYPAMVYQRTPMRALGWGASRLEGEAVYGHEGGKEGYRSAVVFNPRTKTGVVVLTNARTDDGPMDLARYLLFGGGSLPPAKAAPTRPTIVALSAEALDSYAGRYRLDSNDFLIVARKDTYLLVDSMGGGVSTFFPSSDREFFSNTENESLVFEKDVSGRATGLIRRAGSTTQHGSRIGAGR
jgi:serine-type D-Ala-D-Ala carboxypeptidase/endopeptidase